MVVMNLFAGQQWRHKHREQTCGHDARGRGWDELRETYLSLYIKQRAGGNLLHDSGS